MSVNKKYCCIVCGRKFPHGQGIIITYGSLVLTFHSNRCASKFFKTLLERIPPEEIEKYIKRLVKEYEERLKKISKTKTI